MTFTMIGNGLIVLGVFVVAVYLFYVTLIKKGKTPPDES